MRSATYRALPLVTRVAETSPAAQACCGICRTCVSTNVATLALASVAALAPVARRLFRR
ncbi:MAG TPA: hypothetical protein VKU41_23285 [Polyangiaceae bacterium]|nr:hypothetical protein [Polyangiaceae bacterium]